MRELSRPPKTVDLHAESFIDHIAEYEQDELLAESIEYLREMLDAALYWEYNEIKFIHGKGTGALKKSVYQELQFYKEAGLINNYHPYYHNEDIVVVHIGI